MTANFDLAINHPVFGEKCQVYIKSEANCVDANYEDGYLESPGYFEIESMEVLEINDKKYAKSVMMSMANFIGNHYEEELQESFCQ